MKTTVGMSNILWCICFCLPSLSSVYGYVMYSPLKLFAQVPLVSSTSERNFTNTSEGYKTQNNSVEGLQTFSTVYTYLKWNESNDFHENSTISFITNKFKNVYPIHLWIEHGFFEENYLSEFNLHWLQFSPPSKISHYSLAILYVIIMATGMCGNALVIFMFIR